MKVTIIKFFILAIILSTQATHAYAEDSDTLYSTIDSFILNDCQGFQEIDLKKDENIIIKKDTQNIDTARFFNAFITDHIALWKSPLKMNAKKYLFCAPVFVATALSFRNDERIYSSFKNYQDKNKWVDNLSPVITMGGDKKVVIGTALAFYGGGTLFNNTKAKQTGIMALQALGHAGIIVTVCKILTGRERPSCNNGISSWHWFPSSLKQFGSDMDAKYNSFPSGHTIAVWSVATVIAKQYRKTIVVPILAYGLATGVGLSRVTEDAHWLSDVIVGAAMGYTIGSFVVKTHKNSRWMLFPTSTGKIFMIAGTYRL